MNVWAAGELRRFRRQTSATGSRIAGRRLRTTEAGPSNAVSDCDPEDESFWIGGLIIDRRHQRRGYGRAVVAQLLDRAASDGHREAALSYDSENTLAQSLYASMGFVETGELVDNETVARRQLT
jgi:ribosomal protein S18 acetylase RimI-like enzyme